MGRQCLPKFKLTKIMGFLQIILGALVISVSTLSLYRFYSLGFFFHNEDLCHHFYNPKQVFEEAAAFDVKSLSRRIEEVLVKFESLQAKLESKSQKMENLDKKYLDEEIIKPLQNSNVALRQIRLPKPEGPIKEEPLINFFITEEIRKYITPKENRVGTFNVFGSERVFNTIGHACVLQKKDLEKYMDYEIGSYCDDDWDLAQKLMLNGCDPLPRRRCLTRASKSYQRPYPINESLWKLPDDRNVRWGNYQCRNFQCLSSKNPKRGFSKCSGCFEMEKEKLKWVTNSTLQVDFLISDVLGIKPWEIRVGLDFGIGSGTFAARMREHNVTIVTTALNLGAPFSEMIALRGLVPLYVTLVHTSGVMDGWIDLLLLDFIIYDWDRILRPGGLLWIDRFFCRRKDLEDYMYMFLQLRYKKHKWAISPKSKDEVYLSALLEKPPRAI